MALVVNSNIASLNAQRNLTRSGNALNKSLERLSSGLRINRAGDDAAGLAISEGLRSQIRGLNQAVRNSNDGLSLIGTAESAIGAYTDMLQRIRELSVQAANDTNSAANRAALQEEADQLLQEMSRIATTVEFNGTKLLDGTFIAKQLQVGANVNQTIAINTGNLRTEAIGSVAITTGGPVLGALTSGELLINGVDVGSTSNDGISFANQNASAIAVASAINAISGDTGVRAIAQPAVVTGSISAIQAIALDGSSDSLTINGINIGAVVVQAGDLDGALRDKINLVTNVTGVTASTNGSNQLVLTAADGRNITVETAGGDGVDLGVGEAFGLIADGGAGDVEENLTVAVTTAGGVKLTADSAFSISGSATGDAGFTTTAVAIDTTTAINTLSISTVAGANSAIETLDAALLQVNAIRSGLGAITNRLDITIQSLQTISENLSASDSRIRDTDFALETANLTRAQILQQAGISILAQANATTQAAVQLLQG